MREKEKRTERERERERKSTDSGDVRDGGGRYRYAERSETRRKNDREVSRDNFLPSRLAWPELCAL